MAENGGVPYWVHKSREQRFARVHRTTCRYCECGEDGCLSFHSYTAAWRSASDSGLQAANCKVCQPED